MPAFVTTSGPAFRSALRTGWVPATLLILLAGSLLRGAADVGIDDQLRFAVYMLACVTFPGTVVWRFVDRRGARPLVEDLALGTLVGYVVEFPVYLALLGLGHPRWYVLWPCFVLAACLGTSRGRTLLWRRGPRMTPGWSWSVAGLLGYAVMWCARNVWGPAPATGESLRRPYVDEPYHLSLIASLRHFSPPKVLYVQDTPLDYHYLSHVHMAAASWVSDVEPIVLLRALALPTVAIAVLLALAVAAARLSDRAWLGPAALAGILVVPANFSGGFDGASAGFLSLHLEISPSAGFTNVGLLLGIVLVVELLRRDVGGIAVWSLTLLTMVAMCGAKATSLPAITAGLLLATVVASAAARSIAWRPLALTALGGASFLIARALFFGKNAQGLEIDPFGTYGRLPLAYPNLAGPDGSMSLLTELVIALSILSALALGAGVLVGLLRGGWRETPAVFLVGLCGAGYGMALSLHQVGYSEGYFIVAVQLPLILGAALGISRHADHLVVLGAGLGRRGGVRLVALAVGAGLLAGLLYTALTRPLAHDIDGPPAWVAFRLYAIPALTVVLGAGAVTAGVVSFLRRRGHAASAPGTVTVSSWAIIGSLVLAGIGMAPTAHQIQKMIADPVPGPPATATTFIGKGGIGASRFLREHAPLDAVIATNAHCQFPPKRNPTCLPRHFWMAGYSERQFLVEGWAYVSRASVGLNPPPGENITTGPFWDPERLAENDLAFTQPSAENVALLREKYGVTWLLVDRAYPVDIKKLREFADPVHVSGRYTVLRLR